MRRKLNKGGLFKQGVIIPTGILFSDSQRTVVSHVPLIQNET